MPEGHVRAAFGLLPGKAKPRIEAGRPRSHNSPVRLDRNSPGYVAVGAEVRADPAACAERRIQVAVRGIPGQRKVTIRRGGDIAVPCDDNATIRLEGYVVEFRVI